MKSSWPRLFVSCVASGASLSKAVGNIASQHKTRHLYIKNVDGAFFMNSPTYQELVSALRELLVNAEDKEKYINILEKKEQFDKDGRAVCADSPEMERARKILDQVG